MEVDSGKLEVNAILVSAAIPTDKWAGSIKTYRSISYKASNASLKLRSKNR